MAWGNLSKHVTWPTHRPTNRRALPAAQEKRLVGFESVAAIRRPKVCRVSPAQKQSGSPLAGPSQIFSEATVDWSW